MQQYDVFYRFYDKIEVSHYKKAKFLKKELLKANSNTVSILEIGCGTGMIMEHLEKDFEIDGLDISEKQLSIAKKKLPYTRFYHQDIRNMEIEKKYDAVIAIYDVINHLKTFKDLKKTFRNVKNQLKPKGVFIFDLNSWQRLDFLNGLTPVYKEFDEGYYIMDSLKKKNRYDWNVKVFEKLSDNKLQLHEETISEYAHDIKKIRTELKNHFSKVIIKKIVESIKESPPRIYFIAKK